MATQRYACIDKDGAVIWANRRFEEKPADPIGKGWRILPVVEEKPDYDGNTEEIYIAGHVERDGVVIETWAVKKRERTPAEILEDRLATLEEQVAKLLADRSVKAGA